MEVSPVSAVVCQVYLPSFNLPMGKLSHFLQCIVLEIQRAGVLSQAWFIEGKLNLMLQILIK